MNEFKQRMSDLSNEQLLIILNEKRQEYVEQSIIAVEEILKERGVVYEKKPDEQFIIEDEARTNPCRFIPFDALSFLGDGFVKHELRGNWHDSISETYVVVDKRLKALKQ